MCQGVIVSLVKFRDGKSKKVRRCVLSGIGSHSSLIARNQKKLKRLGWTGDAEQQEVVSIEADFSAWNNFTIESGNPTKSDLSLLKREYKKCAGSAKALVAHVKRCGKIDDSLVALLTAPALKQYDEATAPALKQWNEARAAADKQWNEATAAADKQWNEATAPARKQYDEARAAALKQWNEARAAADKQYDEATAPALKQWNEARAAADKQYDEATAPALKQWNEARAAALKQWNEATAPARKQYDEARAAALKQWNEARAAAWCKLFAKKENRVPHLH